MLALAGSRLLRCAIVGFASACATGREPVRPELAAWQSHHQLAAEQLCSFVRSYPTDANRLRLWLGEHPIQSRQLLEWAAENRGSEPPMQLLPPSPGLQNYQPARDPFVWALYDWAATHPDAARDIASTPHAIEWALDGRNC